MINIFLIIQETDGYQNRQKNELKHNCLYYGFGHDLFINNNQSNKLMDNLLYKLPIGQYN
jgi:hypothetical protein